jgi:plastocyanin
LVHFFWANRREKRAIPRWDGCELIAHHWFMTAPTVTTFDRQRENSDGVSLLALMTAGLAVVFAIASFGFAIRNKGGGGGGAAKSTKPAVTTAEVTLTDFKIKSSITSFPAGPIALEIKNEGGVAHSLKIDGIGETKELKVGQSAVLSLGSLEPGTYTWYCTVAGHKDVGMTGTFTVVPATQSEGDSASAPVGDATQPSNSLAPAVETIDWKKVDAAHETVVKWSAP